MRTTDLGWIYVCQGQRSSVGLWIPYPLCWKQYYTPLVHERTKVPFYLRKGKGAWLYRQQCLMLCPLCILRHNVYELCGQNSTSVSAVSGPFWPQNKWRPSQHLPTHTGSPPLHRPSSMQMRLRSPSRW